MCICMICPIFQKPNNYVSYISYNKKVITEIVEQILNHILWRIVGDAYPPLNKSIPDPTVLPFEYILTIIP